MEEKVNRLKKKYQMDLQEFYTGSWTKQIKKEFSDYNINVNYKNDCLVVVGYLIKSNGVNKK